MGIGTGAGVEFPKDTRSTSDSSWVWFPIPKTLGPAS